MAKQAKKVFISYAWGDENYDKWVIDLAIRLIHDSVDVLLDKWDLQKGQDKYAYMEKSVNDPTVSKVLILCDSNYSTKADERTGGVGTETTIISKEVYDQAEQRKFIPIISARDDDGNLFMPTFLKSRIYIDLSRDEHFEAGYEELIRDIFETPSLSKPRLGVNPPAYISEPQINTFPTSSMVRSLQHHLEKSPKSVSRHTANFFERFSESLWEFEMSKYEKKHQHFGQDILDNLHLFQPLKRDFIDFYKIASLPEYDLDADEVIQFFEMSARYKSPKDPSVGSWYSSAFEIFSIIFRELFLYCVSIGIKNRNYNLVSDLIFSTYSFRSRDKINENKTFTGIISRPDSFVNYVSNVLRKTSSMAHYLIPNIYYLNKEDLITGDVLCYVNSFLSVSSQVGYKWYPDSILHIGDYRDYHYNPLPFFSKLESLRFFEKVKSVFNVKSADDLSEKIEVYKKSIDTNQRISYGPFNYIPFVHEIIDGDNIGKSR